MSILVSALFHARTQAHVFHFRTRSYATHKAMEQFYTAVIPLADQYAETYQGRYGLIKDFSIGPKLLLNPLQASQYFHRLYTKVRNFKSKDTALRNIQDSIAQLVAQTIYMLSLSGSNVNQYSSAPKRVRSKTGTSTRRST